MALVISVPSYCQSELEWTCSVLFGEFLGIDYQLRITNCSDFLIEHEGRAIHLPDIFFAESKLEWMTCKALPVPPTENFCVDKMGLPVSLIDKRLPVLFGKPDIEFGEKKIKFGFDVLGMSFFMLSRYEEMVCGERDNHERFPATASIAHKAGFLDRPIVDEYVELLWAAIQRLWPGVKRKHRQAEVVVTCDVDSPFDNAISSPLRFARALAGDLISRRNISAPITRIRNVFASRQGIYDFDPNYCFDWYMSACEKAGRRVAFYFISDSSSRYDGCYRVDEPRMLKLMASIADRGHELGVHGSYNSFRDKRQIMHERQCMVSACKQAKVEDIIKGNRQHYLRWDCRYTPDYLDAAGYDYDTSGSFADMPGFRYGTSKTFSMWSWQRNGSLRIKQQPLTLMECSVIAGRYMGMGYSPKSLELMLDLKRKALRFGGNFVLLWHNSHLSTQKDKAFFQEIIS